MTGLEKEWEKVKEKIEKKHDFYDHCMTESIKLQFNADYLEKIDTLASGYKEMVNVIGYDPVEQQKRELRWYLSQV